MNRNLFRLSRLIILKLPRLIRFLNSFRKKSNRILIIKLDAIGDYILFRNFLEYFKSANEFKNYKIDLIGNVLWQDLAKEFDSKYIDNFIFIQPENLSESPLQLLQICRKISKLNYTIVLNPSFSRTLITDGIAALTGSKNIIGFHSDIERISSRYKKKTDLFYHKKFILPNNIYFEFDRTKYFFEQVLNIKISLKEASLIVSPQKRNTVVLFPGAGFSKRSWEKEKFLTIIKLILDQTDYEVILSGGSSEEEIGFFLANNLNSDRVSNLINLTTLVQLTNLIASSSLVIANETSAIHIASACNVLSICILGGGHFGRFMPYPENFTKRPICIYERLSCFNCNWVCEFETREKSSFPCIALIEVEQVWNEIKSIYNFGKK